MATFTAYFTYGGEDGLTKHERAAGGFTKIDDAYLHLLRNMSAFGQSKNANGVDGYVKQGGKRVHLDNPTRMRELIAQVAAEKTQA